MISLAVNTATQILSLALVRDGAVLAEAQTPESRDQGNFLLTQIDKMLVASNLAYEDLDLMVAVTGPGSFTGIRIGLAAMRGIALAANRPLVGISSFDFFATTMPQSEHQLVAVESWREELYFRLDNHEPVNIKPSEMSQQLKDIGPIAVAGDAAHKMRELLPQATFVKDEPTAVDLARLALIRTDLHTEAVPFYLRAADVTLATDQRHLKSATGE